MQWIWMGKIMRLKGFAIVAVLLAVAEGIAQGPPPATVEVEEVIEIRETAAKEYIGNIKAAEEVNLLARIAGAITGINFKEGSLVKKGDLLFTIEDTTYRAKSLAAKAKVDQAAAELRYAESNYKRQKLLAGKDAVSKSNLEDAERLIENNRAKHKQAEAELLDTENELSYTKIFAPISGRIGEVKHTYGNYVSLASTPLAKIVSVDPIQAKFALSERDFLNLFKSIKSPDRGLNITIRLSNGKVYAHKGRVAFIDNEVDKDTGTIGVWVEFDNPEMELVPGGYITALVSDKMKSPLPGVRQAAVLTDSRGSYVYAINGEGLPERRNVILGEVVGFHNIVKSGLRVGELVVVDGTHKVIPGMKVNAVRCKKNGGSGKS